MCTRLKAQFLSPSASLEAPHNTAPDPETYRNLLAGAAGGGKKPPPKNLGRPMASGPTTSRPTNFLVLHHFQGTCNRIRWHLFSRAEPWDQETKQARTQQMSIR